ncbi:MAG: T9SS type A sorting domain-containing protein [Fimbriimonadaceae bacterium]|nr:T9SS type A sorting domain-containing protein [Chitinophagales bacterium]
MKKLFTLIIASFLMMNIQFSFAQSWGYAGYGHWMEDISEAADGSIWSVGYGGEMADWSDVLSNYVVKLNTDGTLDWKGAAPIGFAGYAEGSSILPVSGGGAVVLMGYNYDGPIIYKLDDDGVVEWTNESWYNTVGFFYYYGGQITQLSDGRFILGGLSDDLQYHFSEISEDGDLLSNFSFDADTTGGWGWSYFDFQESGIVSTDDGGFAFSAGTNDTRTLHKFDSGLNLEWDQAYPHGTGIWEYNNTWNDGLSKTSDGGYLLSGSSADAFVYAGSLRKIASDGTLEWVKYYNHGASWEEGSGAIELGTDNYIVWTQDHGDQSSHGWVTDADGNEVDSIFIPLPGCNWGFGNGLEVWSAAQTADGGYVIAGRQYMEDCNQRYTILKSNADGSLPECIWNCVWPGDANNDMYATADDLFEIGINYGATGTSRMDMGIDWEAKLSSAWMEEDSIFWYVLNDLKWTDCNGDGIINDDDTTAVINNFGLDHPLNALKTSAGDVPLYFAPTEPILHIGLNKIPIMLGDGINSVDEIYGLRFTVTVEGEDIDAASLKVNYTNSWFTNEETRLNLSVNDADNMRVFTGVVRTDRENTGGNGEIGTLDVVVIDNITGKTEASEVTLAFSEVKAIKLNREEISLAAEALTYGVEEGSAVEDLLASAVNVYPTIVSNNEFTIESSSLLINEIIISDVTGRILNAFSTGSVNKQIVNVDNLTAGEYFVQVTTNEGNTLKKIIIQ